MRRMLYVVFVSMIIAAAATANAQQSSGYFVPGSSDEAGYMRDELILEDMQTTQTDVYFLAQEVNNQAGQLASLASRSPMSQEQAQKVIELGNKVTAAQKDVDKKIKDAERRAAGKNYEPAGLAEKTWKKVKSTAEEVIVAVVKPKADKAELERLQKRTEEIRQEIKTRLDQIEEDIKKLKAEIEALKAKDLELEAAIAQEKAQDQVDKEAQDERDDGQDTVITNIGDEVTVQKERLDKGEKKQQELEAKLDTKAEIGLVYGYLGTMIAISPNKETRLYALTLGGEYIIRKDDWLRVGIGGSVGSSFKEFGQYANARFYFDSRIRAGYCWKFVAVNNTGAEVTLSPYGTTYSSGMPYSDQWGIGGGLSLQFDFRVTHTLDGLRMSLELFGGYARDWRTIDLDAPPEGGFYTKSTEEAKNVFPVGVRLGLTF